MKKKVIALALALALGSASLVGCASGDKTAQSDKIIIGGAMCLTGIQAPLDQPALEGIQLGVDKINADGGINGKQVEFINMDGKSDPVTVGDSAKQLIDKGAVAIITPSDYDFGSPAAREAQTAGLVGISPCASSPLFGSTMLGDKQFTLSMWNTTMGAVTAEYAYNEKDLKTAYVVTDDFIDYTKSLSKYFSERFTELGGKVVKEDTFSQGKLDTAAFLAHYKSLKEKPDFIYISSYMPDLATVIKDFRMNGIDVPVYGGDSYDDPSLFDALGAQYGNDVIYDTHSYLSEEAVPGFDEFKTAYEKKFDKPLDAPWSMAGYDVVMVLAKSMNGAESTDGAKVAKYMEDNEFECLTGKLNWGDAAKGHEPNKAAALVQLQGGKTEFLGWKTPEKIPAP